VNASVQFAEQTDLWSRRGEEGRSLGPYRALDEGTCAGNRAVVEALQALLEPGDAVALEGDNQKQADFLSRALVQVDPGEAP